MAKRHKSSRIGDFGTWVATLTRPMNLNTEHHGSPIEIQVPRKIAIQGGLCDCHKAGEKIYRLQVTHDHTLVHRPCGKTLTTLPETRPRAVEPVQPHPAT